MYERLYLKYKQNKFTLKSSIIKKKNIILNVFKKKNIYIYNFFYQRQKILLVR